MKVELTDYPVGYTDCHENVMSNFDRIIEQDVVTLLKEESVLAGYPGWNFHSRVWFDKDKNKFMANVWQYHCHVATFQADTPEELMTEISDEYGYD